jgi:hypothetical protein
MLFFGALYLLGRRFRDRSGPYQRSGVLTGFGSLCLTFSFSLFYFNDPVSNRAPLISL